MPNWIDLDGLANLRDLGGTPTTDGGSIRVGRLWRSDNLQTLTPADITQLLERGLTDVVDLRSGYEVRAEGSGPLTRVDGVVFHHHSLIPERETGEEAVEDALPWVGMTPSVRVQNEVASNYLSYLADRPESVVASLRDIAGAEGAALVHCAAGKDRTGTIVALALRLAGAEREAVIADYAVSTERMQQILDRLMASDTYRDNLIGRPMSSHITHAETMAAFLDHIDEAYGGIEALLASHGWTPTDTEALRAKLRD